MNLNCPSICLVIIYEHCTLICDIFINTNLADIITTRTFLNSSISMTAGTIGTYATNYTQNISLSGYTAIGCCISLLSHPASYRADVTFGNKTNRSEIMVLIYRTTSSAYTIPANDIQVEVIYKKTS